MFQTRLSSLILLVIACGGCRMAAAPSNLNAVQSTPVSQAAPSTPGIPADTEIGLERRRCDLRCPVYKLTLSADGKVVYEGRNFVKRTGTIRSNIDEQKLAALIAEIERINYFSLQDKYIPGANCPQVATDYPTVITSVRINGRSHMIEHYHGCSGSDVLQELINLETKIDQAVNTEQWIN
jgi:hypothetical protein